MFLGHFAAVAAAVPPPLIGFWAVLHEVRSEYAQLLSVLFLCLAGPGPWSVDSVLRHKQRYERHELETVLSQ